MANEHSKGRRDEVWIEQLCELEPLTVFLRRDETANVYVIYIPLLDRYTQVAEVGHAYAAVRSLVEGLSKTMVARWDAHAPQQASAPEAPRGRETELRIALGMAMSVLAAAHKGGSNMADTYITPPEGEHYSTEDTILPELDLPNPCKVSLSITADYISVVVGQRDFGWKRGNPHSTDSGTFLGAEVPDGE